MVTLAAACARFGCWGWRGGYIYCAYGGLNDPSMIRMRELLYLSSVFIMSLSMIVSKPVVRGCDVVI